MSRLRRFAFSRVDLLVVLLVVGVSAGLLVSSIDQARAQGRKVESLDKLKQLGIACHTYHDANNQFPSGNDKNNFSAAAYLLPYLEQENVFKQIDFTKPIADKANAAARAVKIKVFINSLDNAPEGKFGPTNFLYSAGSKLALEGNDGIFYQGSSVTITDISAGTSNTLMIGETLRGDPNEKEPSYRRQYVGLTASEIKAAKDDAGVQDFKDKKNLHTDRCTSWMDGRFLQGTFTATLVPNSESPDVDFGGLGGLSALRSTDGAIRVAFCDGSVRSIRQKVDLKVWKAIGNRTNDKPVKVPD
jgi:hypothetical protein